MIKQIIALIALSVGIVLSMSYAQVGMHWLLQAHDWISHLLTDIFSGGNAGNLARGLIALLSIPVIVALVPTAAYWVARRHWFPYFMELVWITWLIQAGALLVLAKA